MLSTGEEKEGRDRGEGMAVSYLGQSVISGVEMEKGDVPE